MIKFEIKNKTGIIILNRPEKRNALHPKLIKQLKEKLQQLKFDENIQSIVITGEGSTFCAGADIENLKSLSNNSVVDNLEDSKLLAELFMMIYEFPKPTIAAVNGAAIAGGCGLTSVCDFIVAHPEKSKFGYSEVKIGFIPAIVSIFLIRRVGEGLAKQLLMGTESITGNRAYEIGFVNYLAENVFDEALNLAAKLNNNSLESMKLTKQMINSISNLSVKEAVDYCIGLNVISRSTNDFKDGLNNF